MDSLNFFSACFGNPGIPPHPAAAFRVAAGLRTQNTRSVNLLNAAADNLQAQVWCVEFDIKFGHCVCDRREESRALDHRGGDCSSEVVRDLPAQSAAANVSRIAPWRS